MKMKTLIEKNGFKVVQVSNYGASGYMILNAEGQNVLGYVYQGSEASVLRIFERKMKSL